MQAFYVDLQRTGTQTGWLDRMMTRKELYELICYARFTEYEREFLGQAQDPVS